LIFALKALQWSRTYEPLNSFNPNDYGNGMSPGEVTLLKALTTVKGVPASPSESAARDQFVERLGKVTDTALDVVRTGQPQWSALITAAAPTKTTDGTSASKAVLTQRLEDALQKYGDIRFPPTPALSPKDIKPKETGPTLSRPPR
jgi:hypothetical protein